MQSVDCICLQNAKSIIRLLCSELIYFVMDPTLQLWKGVVLAVCIFATAWTRALCNGLHVNAASIVAMRVRTMITAAVYRKVSYLVKYFDTSLNETFSFREEGVTCNVFVSLRYPRCGHNLSLTFTWQVARSKISFGWEGRGQTVAGMFSFSEVWNFLTRLLRPVGTYCTIEQIWHVYTNIAYIQNMGWI